VAAEIPVSLETKLIENIRKPVEESLKPFKTVILHED
jgi:hypothetical protein